LCAHISNTCIYIYIYIHTCSYIRIHMYTYPCIYTWRPDKDCEWRSSVLACISWCERYSWSRCWRSAAYTCINTHAHTHARTNMCTYVCVYTHLNIYGHECSFAKNVWCKWYSWSHCWRLEASIHIFTHAHTQTCVCMYICTNVWIYMSKYFLVRTVCLIALLMFCSLCMYTHAHTHTHTDIRVYVYTNE